ncbi:hypothetical protein [Acetanaerobacterium elongatum]|uniref:Lipoprotein n=1 Tax=Acetanaerobacterium elongatum TaxID=258515 RepID=A0A1G9XWM6_9FIRM|nr:hypothetical protein [Acetanaerobacterium elongatum]SDN01252.1 hypothetical protein SAMN05192585_10971 [Acetanaerobacterium elongatum]
MRKVIGLMLSLSMVLLCVTGCGTAAAPLKNYAEPMPLTKEQKQLVDLISTGGQQVLLFHFKTEEAYKTQELWVETYKAGKLVDSWPAGLKLGDEQAKPLDIQAAVTITHTPDYQWSFAVREQDGSGASQRSEPNRTYTAKGGSAYTVIRGPVAIESDKEIVLYANVFNEGNVLRTFDDPQSLNNGEALQEYDYVHLIKCRFTKE